MVVQILTRKGIDRYMADTAYEIRRMTGDDAEAVVELSQLFEPVSTTLWRGLDAKEGADWVRERLNLPE